MRRSLFWLLDDYPDADDCVASLHATALEHARIADDLGFASLWLPEHHFQGLGTAANPAVVLAAVAQHTKHIRLGPAVSVLPLRNPIQVAEDYALVDILSGGRLNMGVGSGSQAMEFAGFDADFEGRQQAFDENLRELKRRWMEATSGGRGAQSLNVVPVQLPGPPIYVASNREEGACSIGRDGHSLLTLVSPMLQSLCEVEDRVRAHKRGLQEGGHSKTDAEAVVVVFAHVSDSLQTARRVAAPALDRILAALGAPPGSADIDTMRERGTGLFGSPPAVEQQIARYTDIGVEHLAFVSRFGAMRADVAEQSLRSLAAPTPA